MHVNLSYIFLIYQIVRRQLQNVTYAFFTAFLGTLHTSISWSQYMFLPFLFLIICWYFLNRSSAFIDQIFFLLWKHGDDMNLCQGFLVFLKVLLLTIWISVPDTIPMSPHFLSIFPLPKMKWFSVIIFDLFQWELHSIISPPWRKSN